MSQFVFPNSVYDVPRNLFAVLGSYWTYEYEGAGQVLGMVEATAEVHKQSTQNILELLGTLSRFTTPIYHTENWYPLTLRLSDMNSDALTVPKYGDGTTYPGPVGYGVGLPKQDFRFPRPADLIDAPVVMNRMIDPSLLWTSGTEFYLQDDAIVLARNPFEDVRIAQRAVYTDGEQTDTELVLWVYRGQWEWELVYEQFGYAVGVRMQSSAGYRELVNAVFDGLMFGCSRDTLFLGMSAITGIPLVKETEETIEDIQSTLQAVTIITDQHAYVYPATATVTVAVGDVVNRGMCLTTAMTFHEFHRGQMSDGLRAIALGRGLLANCFHGDLIFEDRDVLLQVDEDHASGHTYLSWDMGGFPLDVEKFFDEMHTKGLAAMEGDTDGCDGAQLITYPAEDCDDMVIKRRGTLAQLLDTRANPLGEPKARHLPATINPLRFLITNVLRHNTLAVTIQVGQQQGGLGLHNMRHIQKIVPKHIALIVILELSDVEDSVTVEDLDEAVTAYIGMEPLSDDFEESAVEAVITRRISVGYCQ